MKLLDYFVRAKVYSQRSIIYFQFVQLGMIFAVFLRDYDFTIIEKILIFVTSVILILILGHFDKRYVLEREQSNYNEKNRELKEIKDLLMELKNDRRN